MRYCDAEGNLPEDDDRPPPAPFRPWHAFHDPDDHGGRTVVFGHWAAQGLHVRPGLRGLDSGCVWGNRLSAFRIQDESLIAVSCRKSR